MSSGATDKARELVKRPALTLLSTTVVLTLVWLALFFVTPALFQKASTFFAEQGGARAQPPPETGHSILEYLELVLGLAGAGFVVFGAFQMWRLRSWPIALAACIVAMLPYVYIAPCCFVFGLAPGVWGAIILFKPEVKSAFS
jgi:hypothetical protein